MAETVGMGAKSRAGKSPMAGSALITDGALADGNTATWAGATAGSVAAAASSAWRCSPCAPTSDATTLPAISAPCSQRYERQRR